MKLANRPVSDIAMGPGIRQKFAVMYGKNTQNNFPERNYTGGLSQRIVALVGLAVQDVTVNKKPSYCEYAGIALANMASVNRFT